MTERDLRKLNRTDLLELLLQQSREMEQLQEELPDKPVTIAIREVADGKLTANLKEEYK